MEFDPKENPPPPPTPAVRELPNMDGAAAGVPNENEVGGATVTGAGVEVPKVLIPPPNDDV